MNRSLYFAFVCFTDNYALIYCFIEIKNVPGRVVGLVNRDVSINCDVILGSSDKVVEWMYITDTGSTVDLWDSKRERSRQTGYDVMQVS